MQAEAAWNALTALCGPEMIATLPPGARSPCRESLASPAAWVGRELQGSEAQEYLNAVGRSLRDLRVVAEIPVIGRSRFRQSLTDGLGKVLAKQEEPKAALESIAMQWRKHAVETGLEKLRDNYRSMMSLPPLADYLIPKQ